MCHANTPHRQQHGFTLLEVMLALLVFLIIAIGILQSEVSGMRAQSRSQLRDEGLRLAEDEMRRLQSLPFTQGTTHSDLDETTSTTWNWSTADTISVPLRGTLIDFTRSRQVTDISGGTVPLKQVSVAVGWGNDNVAADGNLSYGQKTSNHYQHNPHRELKVLHEQTDFPFCPQRFGIHPC